MLQRGAPEYFSQCKKRLFYTWAESHTNFLYQLCLSLPVLEYTWLPTFTICSAISIAVSCPVYSGLNFTTQLTSNTVLLVGALQETVGTHVVDGVMEDIRLGMEVNLPKYSQRRVAMIKYLGELYNYRMVESSDIFKVTSPFFYILVSLVLFKCVHCKVRMNQQ
jgi:hypothetical protein